MTLVNIASSAVYLKGLPIKDKIQTYILALVFLVLLYNSPSGLVFYWILNNIFSLCKNLVLKYTKHPAIFTYRLLCVLSVIGLTFFLITHNSVSYKKIFILLIFVFVFCIARTVITKCKFMLRSLKITLNIKDSNTMFYLFISSCVGLALTCGLLLPISIIATSPGEFCYIGNTENPINYVLYSTTLFLGGFVIWPNIIYKMASVGIRKYLSLITSYFLVMALLNVYMFHSDYSRVNSLFILENLQAFVYSKYQVCAFIFMSIGVLVLFIIVYKYGFVKHLLIVSFACCSTLFLLAILKGITIQKTYIKASESHIEAPVKDKLSPIVHLSKNTNAHNVIIIMVDRGINSFFPVIIKEFPEIKNVLEGFVYYPNTLSYSASTDKAVPAMLAGYEYTPEAMNNRPNELLKDKHNEALCLLPTLFSNAGYDVTIIEPPYPDYAIVGGLKIFDNIPNCHAYNVNGVYSNHYFYEHGISSNDIMTDKLIYQRIGAFAFMQTLPLIIREIFYQKANYLKMPMKVSNQIYERFIGLYSSLYYIDELTDFVQTGDTYTFFCTDAAHDCVQLDKDYKPSLFVKDDIMPLYKWLFGKNKIETLFNYNFYQCNVLVWQNLARFFTYLKQEGAYDNTRIIVVADHGQELNTPCFNDKNDMKKMAYYNPLLLVKDFDKRGEIEVNNDFMTNADTPFFALANLGISDINPFTKVSMKSKINKANVKVYPLENRPGFIEFNAPIYLQKTKLWKLNNFYSKEHGYSVHDNIFDKTNWQELF